MLCYICTVIVQVEACTSTDSSSEESSDSSPEDTGTSPTTTVSVTSSPSASTTTRYESIISTLQQENQKLRERVRIAEIRCEAQKQKLEERVNKLRGVSSARSKLQKHTQTNTQTNTQTKENINTPVVQCALVAGTKQSTLQSSWLEPGL